MYTLVELFFSCAWTTWPSCQESHETRTHLEARLETFGQSQALKFLDVISWVSYRNACVSCSSTFLSWSKIWQTLVSGPPKTIFSISHMTFPRKTCQKKSGCTFRHAHLQAISKKFVLWTFFSVQHVNCVLDLWTWLMQAFKRFFMVKKVTKPGQILR